MRCDLCGRKGELFRVKIEDSIMNVCNSCSNFGNVLTKVNKEKIKVEKKKDFDEEEIEIIREDYSKVIKESRERRGLKQEELAKRINEKVSKIHKLETGEIEPSLELARKLEKFFNIKLVGSYIEKKKILQTRSENITIGDVMNVKRK